ncbi:MAG: hypothetical protein P0Y53_16430 [Candidatus Pseudobacter hemicellulosilyticus]|uniref:Uncharacterized protein n=1 Tax=Candidatus Pseudobacter hemicellulosilyticus TaxID=3121375 RepID=A0AAJ5WNX7_9BACT|nr:MAG: hypothetical protein P0Y53_16430 [Pseudobacter sp.]
MDGVQHIPSPFDKEGTMKSVFVRFNGQSKMGFLWIWCSKTLRGIWISRLEIPDNVKSVSGEEFKQLNISGIKFEDPKI